MGSEIAIGILVVFIFGITIIGGMYIEKAFDKIRNTQRKHDSTKTRVSNLAKEAESNDKTLDERIQNVADSTEKQHKELAKQQDDLEEKQNKMDTALSNVQDESKKLIKDTIDVSNTLSVGSNIHVKDGSLAYNDGGKEVVLKNEKVGINEPNPQSTLDVNGDMSIDGAFNLNGQKLEANTDDDTIQTSGDFKAKDLSFENSVKAPGGTIMTTDSDTIRYNPNGDYEHVSFKDTDIEANKASIGNVSVYGSDIQIKNPSRTSDANSRRALVQNSNDEIELNYSGDYPNGARVGSSLTVDGNYKFDTSQGKASLQVQNNELQFCPVNDSCKTLKYDSN